MSYCINPNCLHRENRDHQKTCASCGTLLLIQGRYCLRKPIQCLTKSKYFEVFEAEDTLAEGKAKILKVLKVNHEGLINLFRREAQVLSWLEHPGIPAVESDGYFSFPSEAQPELHCLVMEKVEGQDLGRWIQDHSLTSPQLTLKWLKELALILDQIHKNNLFHGDIKPSNIIRKPNGQLVLIDFGAVKQTIKMLYGQKEHITLTPGYAAPEQLQKEAVPQSDFYALGRTFTHLLTGRHPIDLTEKDGRFCWRQHIPDRFPHLLADFIDELMPPSPDDRPRNTAEVLKRLDQIFHILLASPTPELPKSSITPEAMPEQTNNKSKSFWKNHKIIIFIAALLFPVLGSIFILMSQLKHYFKLELPIKVSEMILLLDEVTEKQKEIQTVEKGKIVASASFNPGTDTFIVDDTVTDGRRAYVEYRIPAANLQGTCDDTGGATSPVEICRMIIGKKLYIYWKVCVGDRHGSKPTVCSELRRDKT
jgi:serine/threonine protein kinase